LAQNGVTFKPDPFAVLTPENPSSDKATRVALSGTGFRNIVAIAPPGTNPVTILYATITDAAGKSWPATVEYVGPASGPFGVDQVNIVLPAVIDGAGVVNLTLTVDSLRTNPVSVNISSLTSPAIAGFGPTTGPPGSVVSILGNNFGTPEMIPAGRIAISLKESTGLAVSVRPDYVDSSQLKFTLPSLPVDSSTFYYGPVTLCVRVDGSTTCSDGFNLTQPAITSTTPGQTFLLATRASIQNGIATLNQLGAQQVAQALSASVNSTLAEYSIMINSSAAGNPQVVTLQRADGSQVSVTVDSAFLSRLDVLAASLQPGVTAAGASPGAQFSGSALQPSCLTSQEGTLQATRDTYRAARSASASILQTAVLSPVAGALAHCVGATTDSCITDASSAVAAGEVTAHLLSGLLASPLLEFMAIDTQPVFLDSMQILPSDLASTPPTVVQSKSSGSALLLALGQQTGFNVKGRFVSINPAQTAQQVVMQVASDALASLRVTQSGDAAVPKCDLCLKILETCPQCSDALQTLSNNLTNDVAVLVMNDLGNLLPQLPSIQAEALVPLTSGTLRMDPNATNEVTISPACSSTSASVSGLSSTRGVYEPFEFAVDPSVLLLANEISTSALPGSVTSTFNIAVGPAVPQLGVLTDKTAYNSREQAFVTGTGFPANAPIAISIAGPQLTEKIEVIAFSDATGILGTFVPLYDAQQSGAYTLSAFVRNSTIRASASISITAARLAVQVTPEGGNWTSSPQSISVSAPGAQRIYYSVSQSVGSLPPIPNAPSADTHDGVITGSTGSLQLSAVDGQFAAWTYIFTAEDANGLGSVSPAYAFSIDLRQSISGPQITDIKATSGQPVDGQTFSFLIEGSNFDPATAQVLFRGPGCPAGCMIANANLTKSATQVMGSAKLPAGHFSVTVQNGSGAPSNAVPMVVAYGTPTVASIETSPYPPSRGQAFDFTIAGVGFDPSSAIVVFSGPGCLAPAKCPVPNSALVSKSSTQISGSMTLMTDGSFTVTVQNGSSGTPSNNIVPLTVAGARITAITTSPSPVLAGQTFGFTITGSGFDPGSAMVVFSGPGCTTAANCSIPSNALSSISSTQLTGTALLGGGAFTVSVQDGSSGTPSNGLPLAVTFAPPQLSAISTTPNTLVGGQPFTFTITGASFDPSGAIVIFSGAGCTASTCGVANSALTSKSSTQLSGTMTLGGGSFTVTVQNGLTGASSNTLTLSVAVPTPQLTAIATTPTAPANGQAFTFTITGTGFDLNSATVIFSGPGCTASTPCSIPSSALSGKSLTQLSGTATLLGGNFTVTVQNGSSGTPSNSLTLAVSGAAPQLTGINTAPAPPVAGQSLVFTIAGTGFDPASATVIFSGPGCAAATCSYTGAALSTRSATQLIGTAILGGGNFTVTVQNGSSGAPSNTLKLTVPAGTPQLTAISTTPTPPLNGVAFTFTITGTTFDPNSATVIFTGPGCTTSTPCTVANSALSAASATQLSGTATLTGGNFTVTVQNGSNGPSSNSLTFTVSVSSVPIPQLTSISTTPTPPGDSQVFNFTINGTGFDPKTATVFFNGPCTPASTCIIANSALTTSSTQLSGMAVLAAGIFSVTVVNGAGNLSNALLLGVATSIGGGGTPLLSGIVTTPNQPVGGQAFTFTVGGSGFDPTSAVVTFNGPGCTPCTIANNALSSATTTQLGGTTTLSAGTFTVTVQNSTGGASNGLSLTVGTSTGSGPQISTIATTPTSPVGGQTFTFTITGTGFDPNGVIVSFSGPGCTPCSIANTALSGATSTQLNGTAQLGAGTFTVTVHNGSAGASSNGVSLTVANSTGTAPQITTVATVPTSPTSGQAFTFTITGTGFDPNTVLTTITGPGCSPCSIANTALTSKTATQLTGPATLGAGTFTVTVQNGSTGTASNGVSLTVASSTGTAPQFTALATTPNPPVNGQTFSFAITGTGFDPASAIVNFSGPGCAPCTIANGTLTNKTATQLGGTTMLNAGSFTVTVQNGSTGAPSNGQALTVSGSTPTPTTTGISTSPNPPVTGQSFTFTINGTGFDPNSAMVVINGPSCSPCSISNTALTTKTATQLTGTATLTAGTFTVTVQNGSSGTASNGQSLTVSGSTGGGAPHIDTVQGAAYFGGGPPTGGQLFKFIIDGSGFDPNTVLVNFTGPGCSPCTVTNANLVQPIFTIHFGGYETLSSGTFTVTVQNGSGGTPSNGKQLTVQ
jgi:hypothetical protein